jgi:hypothetical protein
VRDVKDVLVSAYHHARYRRQTTACDLDTFIRDPRTGAEKVLTALSRWADNRGLAERSIVIRYEDIHADAGACLTRTLEFAGHGPVSPDLVRQSVAFCTADNLRKLEQSKFFKDPKLKPGRDKANGAKVRSARIGDHANHMTPALVRFIEDMDAAMGRPLERLLQGTSRTPSPPS